jgi:hypothetical protein
VSRGVTPFAGSAESVVQTCFMSAGSVGGAPHNSILDSVRIREAGVGIQVTAPEAFEPPDL